MTEDQMKLQARLIAIEHVLANAIKTIYLALGITPETVSAAHRRTRETLSMETIPGIDPSQSDLWTAEIQENVERIQANVEEALEWARNRMSQGRAGGDRAAD